VAIIFVRVQSIGNALEARSPDFDKNRFLRWRHSPPTCLNARIWPPGSLAIPVEPGVDGRHSRCIASRSVSRGGRSPMLIDVGRQMSYLPAIMHSGCQQLICRRASMSIGDRPRAKRSERLCTGHACRRHLALQVSRATRGARFEHLGHVGGLLPPAQKPVLVEIRAIALRGHCQCSTASQK